MAEKGKINWLASYPKSGNTWVRVFLTNLLSETCEPVDINELSHMTIASNRQMFDDCSGIASTELEPDEIERIRPYVYDTMSSNSQQQMFIKIHDAYTYTKEGRPLVSEHASNKALYIIRNPLDVAVSLSHHLHVSYDTAVNLLCKPDYGFCDKTDRLPKQLEQKLLSWSMHVESWTQQKLIPVMVVKYEELLLETETTFKKITDYFELKPDDLKFQNAIKYSSFNELQKQEQEKGFKEKAPKAESFFRKGIIGSWKEELSPELVHKITTEQGVIMKKFNYL